MKTRLIRIGNSRGIRLPKPIIEQAGLSGEVELRVREGAVIISASVRPREGWEEAAKEMHRRGEDRVVGGYAPTRFDEEEWEW